MNVNLDSLPPQKMVGEGGGRGRRKEEGEGGGRREGRGDRRKEKRDS